MRTKILTALVAGRLAAGGDPVEAVDDAIRAFRALCDAGAYDNDPRLHDYTDVLTTAERAEDEVDAREFLAACKDGTR